MKRFADAKLIRSVGIGLLTGAAVTLVLTAVFALIITAKPVSLKVSGLLATVILVVSSFVGGFTASLKNGEKGFIVGMLTGAVYYLTVVVLSLALLQSAVTSSLFIKMAVICFSASLGGILGVNRASKHHNVI